MMLVEQVQVKYISTNYKRTTLTKLPTINIHNTQYPIMNIFDILNEVSVIDTKKYVTDQKPLKDNQTIRVYHGFNDPADLANTLIHGLSGTMKAKRTYSYEYSNNPYGLFVTLDFNKAKDFGSYIIEFHAKVKDLEAPVWKGGSYTVQGGYSQYYSGEEERKQDQNELRKQQSKSEYPAISKSDRPDVAQRLLNFPENQALFIGDLNPNSIRAVWISSNPTKTNSKYIRMTSKKVLDLIKQNQLPTKWGSNYKHDNNNRDDFYQHHQKMFKPREEDVTFQKLVDKYTKKYSHIISKDEIANILRNNKDHIKTSVWSKQQYQNILDTM